MLIAADNQKKNLSRNTLHAFKQGCVITTLQNEDKNASHMKALRDNQNLTVNIQCRSTRKTKRS